MWLLAKKKTPKLPHPTPSTPIVIYTDQDWNSKLLIGMHILNSIGMHILNSKSEYNQNINFVDAYYQPVCKAVECLSSVRVNLYEITINKSS